MPVSEAVIAGMGDTIITRGPDDFGTLCNGDFGFGMRRRDDDAQHGWQQFFVEEMRDAV